MKAGIEMTWQQKELKAGLSNRTKVVLVAMVLTILLPVTVVSLPLSKVVVEVTNTDDTLLVDVTVYIYGREDYYSFAFVLLPGEMESVSCSVAAGTHDVRIDYDYPEDSYYGNMIWNSYSVGLFETHHAEFYLYPSSPYYY